MRCEIIHFTSHISHSTFFLPSCLIVPHFVYMLRCAGNRIYTGYAVDVEARFDQHKSGKGAKFTKAFPPECILRKFELPSHEQALRLEARIKKLAREQKELLAGGDDAIAAELLAGLGETLEEKSARERKERRAVKTSGKKETCAKNSAKK
ncbi:MAG: GIY-YIG nuclease family protein [Fibrobacter sp.]|nr:GIY-YIG nuclease family protein [Fibrobacter sp.]